MQNILLLIWWIVWLDSKSMNWAGEGSHAGTVWTVVTDNNAFFNLKMLPVQWV